MRHSWEHPFLVVRDCPDPVFRMDQPGVSLFYTPGYLVLTDSNHTAELDRQLSIPAPSLLAAKRLREYAQKATRAWESAFWEKPFQPLCLTLYTSQRCNLSCSYCFSQGKAGIAEPDLELAFILKATEEVAANCREAQAPFTLVIHGGGEPMLDPRLPEILSSVEEIAARNQLAHFSYLATNGVMSEDQAYWATQHFDEIGLSCDGPADIQDAQRPLKSGRSSVEAVERTAAIIRAAGKALHVRATITPQTVERMPEIAAYLCGSLHAREVRIEPVFQGGRTGADNRVISDQVKRYCECFLEARRIAASFRSRWMTTGSRPGEIHGRYCQAFRDVLHLVPGNGVSACFKVNGRRQAQTSGMEIGTPDEDDSMVDPERVLELRQVLSTDGEVCATCFNRYHCARGCPDHCPADPNTEPGLFRCQMNRMITTALLLERAERLKPALKQHPIIGNAIRGVL